MLQAIFRTVLIGFALLLSSCANYPEPLLIKDTLGISKPLSDALKDIYGLYVPINSKVSSTRDFYNHKLLLLGNLEGHLDMKIVGLSMKETRNFLFKEVIFIDSTSTVNCPTKDALCATKKDTLITGDYKELPRERNTYSSNTDLNKIFERSLNSDDCVFLMEKSNSKYYSNRLKELIIE